MEVAERACAGPTCGHPCVARARSTALSATSRPTSRPSLTHQIARFSRTLSCAELLGYLWTLPDDPTSHVGLGGGITWAWDPALCDALLPRFREDFFFVPFVDCTMLKAAMNRGFHSWSANSARISFVDVTEECARIGQLHKDCPLAELWVTMLGGPPGAAASTDASAGQATGGGGGSALSALGIHEADVPISEDESAGKTDADGYALGGGATAALAQPAARYSTNFRYTNGRRPASGRVIETFGGVISFNSGLCWYAWRTGPHNLPHACPSVAYDLPHACMQCQVLGLDLLLLLSQDQGADALLHPRRNPVDGPRAARGHLVPRPRHPPVPALPRRLCGGARALPPTIRHACPPSSLLHSTCPARVCPTHSLTHSALLPRARPFHLLTVPSSASSSCPPHPHFARVLLLLLPADSGAPHTRPLLQVPRDD